MRHTYTGTMEVRNRSWWDDVKKVSPAAWGSTVQRLGRDQEHDGRTPIKYWVELLHIQYPRYISTPRSLLRMSSRLSSSRPTDAV